MEQQRLLLKNQQETTLDTRKTKNTTFVVNVSKEPTKVTAKNGSDSLTLDKVQSKADFDEKIG